MADYHSPTVIQPPIPLADVTPLEKLVLGLVFESELVGDAMYFFSELGASQDIGLSVAELDTALVASTQTTSTLNAYIAERLADHPDDETEIVIDMTGTSWEFIFQDIVRRSATLTQVTAITSFTCTKMRPDGFGGMAVLITANAIRGKSTEDIICDFMNESEHGELGIAPGFGSHVLARLDERDVRIELRQIIETEGAAKVAADDVSDDDIRAGCLAVVSALDLTEDVGSARFKAALAAISIAEDRRAPSST